VIQGRHDTHPKRRGLAQVPEMIAHGIRVGGSEDCVLDPWYRLGTADMLEVAFMGLHVAQMTSPEAMRSCLALFTDENAAILGIEDYGLRPGARADLVVLDAADPIEALRLRPARLHVVSRGQVVARTDRAPTRMDLPGRPPSNDRRHVQRPR
jgi:cytosine deaminase